MRLFDLQPQIGDVNIGPRAGFGEVVGTAFDAAKASEGGLRFEIDQPVRDFLTPFIQKSKAITATKQAADAPQGFLMNPVSGMDTSDMPDAFFDEDMIARLSATKPLDELDVDTALSILEERGVAIPESLGGRQRAERAAILKQARSKKLDMNRDALQRAGLATGVLGQITGSLGAGFTDPVNIATSFVAAPVRAGFLGKIAVEAALNAGVEVLQTPGRNDTLRLLGEEEQSVITNALQGAALGTGFVLGGKALKEGFKLTRRNLASAGRMILQNSTAVRELLRFGRESKAPEIRAAAQALTADLQDQAEAVANPDRPGAILDHEARLAEAARAATELRVPDLPDRPYVAQPRASILGGAIEEIEPTGLLVQPDRFQFKTEIVGEGGVTPKLMGVKTWDKDAAGIVVVFEYGDGTRAIADGHQRVALAKRIMAQDPSQRIMLAGRVYREADGYSVEDVRVLAAMKNIREAADGMTVKMARDAAKVLRIAPEKIMDLPAGPGITRARNLSALSDDAFDLYINEVVEERFAELVGGMVKDKAMHLPIMRLLEKVKPETTEQARSIIGQALEAPVETRIEGDLFGDRAVTESLYLERAKVLESAMRTLRDDKRLFRTLTEKEGRITKTGRNVLDAKANQAARDSVNEALVAVERLAHRAGPISEALNDGAKAYKQNGRLADAARAVAAAVEREIRRNGLGGGNAGRTGRAAKPAGQGATSSDPHGAFADLNGQGFKDQIEATRDALQPVARPEPMRPATEEDLTPVEEIKMPISPDATPEEALAKIAAMTEENRAIVRDFMAEVDQKFGTKSGDNAKTPESILAKAVRPSILAKKPWHTVAHIRDTYRFKTVIDRIEDVPKIFEALLQRGVSLVKIDTGKLFAPKEWGWRIIAFDLRMPNGQLVEWYLPLRELEIEKKNSGHLIFEEWRGKTDAELMDQHAEYMAAIKRSFDGYDAAFRRALARSGLSVEDAAASWARSEVSMREAARKSLKSSGAITSSADRGLSSQAPSMARNTDTVSESQRTARDVPSSTRASEIDIPSTPSKADIGDGAVKSEATPAGQQTLFPGIEPISQQDRLRAAADRPLNGGQRRSDTEIGGLFDPNDPARFDLFDMVPTVQRAGQNEVMVPRSVADVSAELDADDEFAEQVALCFKGAS